MTRRHLLADLFDQRTRAQHELDTMPPQPCNCAKKALRDRLQQLDELIADERRALSAADRDSV